MLPPEQLLAIVRRANPDQVVLHLIVPTGSARDVWKQLAVAVGVDEWTLARAIAKDPGLEAAVDMSNSGPFATRLIPEV